MRISPEMIAQTTTGTKRIRPNVMRFGILKPRPGALSLNFTIYRRRRACAPGDSDVGGAGNASPARGGPVSIRIGGFRG
jgi:hypothetical protein